MVKKLLYDMLFSLLNRQSKQQKEIFKNHFLKNKKIEIGFLDFYIYGKL